MKNNQMIFLSKYILELYLFDSIFYKYNSLIKACSAVYLTRKFFKSVNVGIKKCAKDLCFMINNINKTNLKAIIHKYSTNEKCNVSLI